MAHKAFGLFNIFFFVCGAAILGLSIYLLVDGNGLTIHDVTIPGAPEQTLWAAAVYMAIAVGGLTLCAGCLGCCAAQKKSSGLLSLYTALVILCAFAEMAVAILAIVFSSEINPALGSNMQTSIATDYTNPNATSSSNPDTTSYNWNLAQTEWKCCGALSYTDYYQSTFTTQTGLVVPYECCVRKAGTANNDMNVNNVQNYTACEIEASGSVGPYTYLYNQGCYTALYNWIQLWGDILIIVGFVLAGLQLIGLVIAMCYK